jgi:hypothetical protein
MYADISSINGSILFQGDIIKDFPFYILENGQPMKKNSAGLFELDKDILKNKSAFLMFKSKKQNIMILSQTCDIQFRNNIIICPVFNLEEFISANVVNADTARSIRERKKNHWFYLPAYGQLPESIADLQSMVYISQDIIGDYLSNRIASLSDLGRHHLAYSLSIFFGRPFKRP